jgi:hypothetical protein
MRKRRNSTEWDEDEDEDETTAPPIEIRALRRQRLRHDHYYEYCHDDPEQELLDILEKFDELREKLQRETEFLQMLLEYNPELAGQWQQFTSAGGVTLEDWERFLAGNFRSRITRTRRHMRLVSNRRPPRIRLRRRPNDDPDEAA